MYSKVIQIGNAGSLTISEQAGSASIAVTLAESAGGGPIAGVAKAALSLSVEVSAQMLVDAGLALALSKYPAFAPEIQMLKGLIDAEMAKV